MKITEEILKRERQVLDRLAKALSAGKGVELARELVRAFYRRIGMHQ